MDKTVTFLIVDDDPSIRRLLKRMVRRENIVWLEADTLHSARECYAKHKASLNAVWADMRLTDGSGLSLAEEVLQETPTLPIVILSGLKPEWRISRGDESNIHYLAKPFTKTRVLEILNHLI